MASIPLLGAAPAGRRFFRVLGGEIFLTTKDTKDHEVGGQAASDRVYRDAQKFTRRKVG
jgi:hypothetical protein